jgi:hypothetical protein
VFHPSTNAGSIEFEGSAFPKNAFPIPHSPLAAGFRKLQSGTKSPSASVQPLLSELWNLLIPAGLKFAHSSTVLNVVTYRPTKNFRAVFPLPNRS